MYINAVLCTYTSFHCVFAKNGLYDNAAENFVLYCNLRTFDGTITIGEM